jgi:hypothetical protein
MTSEASAQLNSLRSRLMAEFYSRRSSGLGKRRLQKIGRFELADKGTLFLDEVGDKSRAAAHSEQANQGGERCKHCKLITSVPITI